MALIFREEMQLLHATKGTFSTIDESKDLTKKEEVSVVSYEDIFPTEQLLDIMRNLLRLILLL